MDDALARIADEPTGVLSTVRPDGSPHAVPVVYAVSGQVIYTPIDWKPKSGRKLQRLINIEANPSVSLLVHHYSDVWSDLWWVRVDGVASFHPRDVEGLDALVSKYPQYLDRPPEGGMIRIGIERFSSWSG